jgi:predicted transposase/invertase (TIGR01784 family)
VSRLDPTLDVVFKLLLVRRPELLADMLECTLARPVGAPTILDPTILGHQVRDKRSILDVRVSLSDGSRAGIEMQRHPTTALAPRLVYYNSRDYADQLRQGDGYERLTPSASIIWMVRPLFEGLGRLHSIFKLREEHTGTVFSEHTSFHLIQLSTLSPQSSLPWAHPNDYAVQVERWARFFSARSPAELDRLASENRIMSLAKQTLEELEKDREAQRLARVRSDEIKFYNMTLVASRDEGRAEGEAKGRDEGRAEGETKGRAEGETKGRAEIVGMLLSLRFGPPSEATRARVAAATSAQLEAWAARVLTASSLDEVLAP